MNWDTVKGQWKMLKGDGRKKWGKLTDDDWETAKGDREQLEGAIQKRYGLAKDAARDQVDAWLTGLSKRPAPPRERRP
jgi:uncharacterized protein YjbJ (UPF0337 family)